MASLWMLFASFAFAAMGVCVKLASGLYTTSEIVMYRGIIGSTLLLVLLLQQGGTLRTAFPLAHLWRCAVGVVSLWLWFFAIGKLPLATAVTLNYMAPIWIAFFLLCTGWWQAKQRFEWPLTVAIAMSFVGVTLVLRPAVQLDEWMGATAGVVSSIISAMAYMQVRRLGQMGEPEYRVVFYFSLMGAVTGMVGALTLERGADGAAFHAHTQHGALLLLGAGVAALFAQMAMTRAYRVGKVLVVANLQYTGIIFSSIWGMIIWGDVFDWHVWLGMGVILASGVAATFYNTGNTRNTRSTPGGAAITETDPIASEL